MLILFLTTASFLFIRLLIVFINYIDDPVIPQEEYTSQKLISVLIPARNEADRILKLLKSLSEQNYQNLEIIVLDDNSEDNTYEVVNEYQHNDSRVKVLKGEHLPDGWLGKNFACHQLAKMASGDYFLFLDADVRLSKKFIGSALYYLKKHKLSLLSVFNDQEMKTLGENLLVPNMHYILLTLLPLRFIRKFENPGLAAASGQCMLFESSVYRDHLWHEKAKDCIAEDIIIMRKVKEAGFKSDSRLAGGEITCRMYNSYNDALHGFSKNLLAGFGNRTTLVLYLLLTILFWIPFVFTLPLLYILISFVLIIFMKAMISSLSGQPIVKSILLHPLQMAAFVHLAWVSLKKSYQKSNTWKGRNINSGC